MINKSKQTETQKTDYTFEVIRAKSMDWGIPFDLKINGITVYNCIYREGVKDGKEWSMVSFPSYQGKDGKYYNHCWAPLSKAHTEQIAQLISEKLTN